MRSGLDAETRDVGLFPALLRSNGVRGPEGQQRGFGNSKGGKQNKL